MQARDKGNSIECSLEEITILSNILGKKVKETTVPLNWDGTWRCKKHSFNLKSAVTGENVVFFCFGEILSCESLVEG